MRFPQLDERVIFWLTLLGRKKGGINENCLSLKGFESTEYIACCGGVLGQVGDGHK